MSDKISYILEVLDKYSPNTKKLKKEISSLESCVQSLNNQLKTTSLNVGKLGSSLGLTQAIKQTDSLKRNIDNLNRSSQQSVNITKQQARALGNTRRAFAGSFTPIKFNPYEGKYQPIQQKTPYEPQPQPQQPSRRGGFFAGGDGVSLTNVAKGMGFYRAIDMAVSAPSKIHDVTVEMDSLRAGLSALIPTVKGMENATAESEVAYLRSISNKYGFAFSDVAPSYLKLMGTGGKTDASLIKGILENVGGYGGLIGMSSPALEGTLRGFQDMLTKQVLNAQEVNLQMQQMPGAKPMLHKAFKRFAESKGVKGITDENVSAKFTAAMATGKLPSVDILREFVKVLYEMFGEEMIKKSSKLRNEEKRLSNAFQELGDEIGLLTYESQIGGVRSLTNLTKSVNGFAGEANRVAEYMKGLFSGILPEKGGVVEKTASAVGGTAIDLFKMSIGSPFYAAKYGGALALAQGASIMGDDTLKENFGSWAKEEFLKNNFEDLQAVYKTDFMSLINALKDGQKVDITIKSDNNIKVEDVKSSRPSTVKAGQK